MSTLTQKGYVGKKTTTEEVVTDRITIGSRYINRIIQDLDEAETNDLLLAGGINKHIEILKIQLNQLSNKLLEFNFIPVISDPIVSNIPNHREWISNRVYFVRGIATYLSEDVDHTAMIGIEADKFKKNGDYVVTVVVDSLPSGYIKATMNGIYEFITITEPGTYTFSMYIENNDIANLDLVIKDVQPEDEVRISRVSVCYVKQQITEYVGYIIEQLVTGGDNNATLEDVDVAIDEFDSVIRTYIHSVVGNLSSVLDQHKEDNNPHGITPSNIDAAYRNHVHPDYNEHLAAEGNVHNLTKSQLGLGNIPNAITDDLDTDSNEVLATAKATFDLNNMIQNLATLLTALSTNIENHTSATGNVHGLEKQDIDLDNVENYPTATEEDEIGYRNDRYTTPYSTRRMMLREWAEATNRPVQLYPVPIQDISLRDFIGTETIGLEPNKKYSFDLSNMEGTNIDDIKITLHLGGNLEDISHLDMTDGDILQSYNLSIESNMDDSLQMISDSFVHDHIRLTPLGKEYTKGKCRFDLDTGTTLLTGVSFSWKINQSSMDIVKLYAVPNKEVLEFIDNNNIYINGMSISSISGDPINIDMKIHELAHVGLYSDQHFIDASPIGAIKDWLSGEIPGAYLELNGSTITKAEHEELYQFAVDKELLITTEEYNSLLSTNGYCLKFGYDQENPLYFRLPKAKEDDYIKIMKYRHYSIEGE